MCKNFASLLDSPAVTLSINLASLMLPFVDVALKAQRRYILNIYY